MGIPAEPGAAKSSPPQPSTSMSVADLPPEALDLAAKLFDFAREGKVAELSAYLDAGISANLTNSKGDTFIMLAAYHGHADTVRLLLDKNADPNSLNDRGQSPIAGAVFKGWEDVVKVLYERGADVRAGHPNAVDSARMFKREEFLRLFGVQED